MQSSLKCVAVPIVIGGKIRETLRDPSTGMRDMIR